MDFVFCPQCEQMNPPETQACQHCKADLSAIPDAPPVAHPLASAAPPPAEEPAEPPAPAAPLPPHIQALEDAVKASPTARALYLQLAQAYESAGQRDRAKATLERYLQIDPNNVWIKQRLDAMARQAGGGQAAAPAASTPAATPAATIPRPGGATATAAFAVPPPPAPRPRPLPPRPFWQRPAVIAGGVAALALAFALLKVFVFPSTRVLVTGTSDAHGPRWSPKGDRIAFLQNRDGKSYLSLYDMDSKAVREVAALGWGGEFAWSPDGTHIAYVSSVEEEDLYGEAVFSVDTQGGKPVRLAMGSGPSWSADSVFVAMTCSGEEALARVRADYMASMSFDGESAVMLQPPPMPAEAAPGLCLVNAVTAEVTRLSAEASGAVAFSPDGSRMVFAVPAEEPAAAESAEASAAGVAGMMPGDVDPMVENIIGQDPTNLAQASNVMSREVRARMYDMKKKRAEEGGSMYAPPGDLFAMPATGGAPTRLTSTGRAAAPTWSKDGSRVFFVSGADKGAEVWSVAAAGGSPEKLFSIPVEAWDPTSVAVSHDGERVVFPAKVQVASEGLARTLTGESPIDLHVIEKGDKAPRRLENKHIFKQRFALSPDGEAVVYEYKNDKTGKSELWLMKL